MKLALIIFGALVLLVLAIVAPLAPGTNTASAPSYPWDIALLPDGHTRVFNLVPGRSTLREATTVFGTPPVVAHVGRRDDIGNVEAFYDGVDLGGLAGKLVVTLALPDDAVLAIRDRATDGDYMESATLKRTLSGEDALAAQAAPVRAIAFVPSARLDDATITLRFGVPAERRKDALGATHYLYPAQGLDIAVGESGKAILQYVAPADFARLATPLDATAPHSTPPR